MTQEIVYKVVSSEATPIRDSIWGGIIQVDTRYKYYSIGWGALPVECGIEYKLGIESKGYKGTPLFALKNLDWALGFLGSAFSYLHGEFAILRCTGTVLREPPALIPGITEGFRAVDIVYFWWKRELSGLAQFVPNGTILCDTIRPLEVIRR